LVSVFSKQTDHEIHRFCGFPTPDLKWLKEAKAEPCCIHAIEALNLKEISQVSEVFDSDAIKTACITYTMRNTLNTHVNSTIQDPLN
jgi:hypothetical protein